MGSFLLPQIVMTEKKKTDKSLGEIAKDFFCYLGKHLPQQCANDEFYFLPRAESAVAHLGRLDDLRAERIQGHIQYVRALLKAISCFKPGALEREIDLFLVKHSMESFVRQFEEAEVWRNDPTLYIKIPLFATDRILRIVELNHDQGEAMLHTLFDQIPSFLRVGIENLHTASVISRQVAIDMTKDASRFYRDDVLAFIEERMAGNRRLVQKNRAVLEAWERYEKGLAQLPSRNHFAIGADCLSRIIEVSLGYSRSIDEILEIAQSGYQETLHKMRVFARRIDGHKTWKRIIYENLSPIESRRAFVELFREEVQKLRRFLYSQDIMTIPPREEVSVRETPPYLKSLRAMASYQAPFTGSSGGRGIFYITPGKEDLETVFAHRSYLCAHETYPGHHVLDHIRIHHPNPIRRQIESPLFYEGWACYVEQLLDELEYIRDPRQQLIQLKRQLWRSLRAIIDVKLQTGKMSLEQAAKEIENIGYSPTRAQRQIRRFCLTPGYQLCYFMGAYEINRMRGAFIARTGLKRFHDTLLGGGQIPFRFVERRLDAYCHDRTSNIF